MPATMTEEAPQQLQDRLLEPLLPPSPDGGTPPALAAAGGDAGANGGNNPPSPSSSSDNSKDIYLPHFLHRLLLPRHLPTDAPRPRINHNVLLTLLLSTLYGLSDSLWSGTVLAAFLKRLGHDKNGPVGDVEAFSGLAALLSALPVGYLADRVGRSKVIGAGGGLILFTSALHAALLWWVGTDEKELDDDPNKRTVALYLLGGIMALWGVAGGVINGPSQALYADSTPAGKRSAYYVYLFACYMLSGCLGPLVSVVLFQTLGDEWDLAHLRTVLYVGLGLEAISSFVMFFFDDTKALDEGEEDGMMGDAGAGGEAGGRELSGQVDGSGESGGIIEVLNADDEEGGSKLSSGDAADGEEAGGEGGADEGADDDRCDGEREGQRTSSGNDDDDDNNENDDDDYCRLESRRSRLIPILLCTQSCIFAVGSGMTVKFFPLFFKEEVGMTPSHVQIIYVIVPIAMVLLSGIAERISSAGFGRVQTMILLNSLGVSCLYAMVFAKTYLDVHPLILVPVYVIRTALMNCTYPLNESILMDYVPKNERARWKSLDSVASFGWCGSAALGGMLTDRFDYTYTFFITAVVQTVGVLAFLPLVPLVPRREEDLSGRR